MKILLFGKDGQLGWELQRSLAPLGDVLALGSQDAGFASDFDRPDELADTVRRVRPDLIVNAAAYTAVDKAESDREGAERVNAQAPAVLAQSAQAVGALLVHFSTDYVFDGSGHAARREDAPTAPLNVYGQTKLEGERLVARHCARHLIFRTSWVYAARGGNFAKTMLRLAQERDRLKVVDDQVGAPTGADLLADLTAHAARATLAAPGKAGLYHAVASGETSWHGYARFVLATARELGVPLKAGPDDVDAVPSSEFATPARRPLNSRLDASRLRAAFDLALPPWQAGVARMLRESVAPPGWSPS
jgi:dTDP-4-dehydrorhamnose reductase